MQAKFATHGKETRGVLAGLADMSGSTDGGGWRLHTIDLLSELHQELASLNESAGIEGVRPLHPPVSRTIALHQPQTS